MPGQSRRTEFPATLRGADDGDVLIRGFRVAAPPATIRRPSGAGGGGKSAGFSVIGHYAVVDRIDVLICFG